MKVTVEKINEINYILSGSVENSVIEQKAVELRAQPAEDESQSEEDRNKQIEQQAAEQVFRAFIDEGIKEAGISVDDLLGQPGLKKYEKSADSVYFEVELATSPNIDLEIDLTDIIPTYTKPKADPKDVDAKFDEFVSKQAPLTTIKTPRPVKSGDATVIDFKGYVDGVAFEGGEAQKFNLKIGSNSFIQGFEDQVIGMEYGETKTITVKFPDAYQAEDLAGKDAQFEVTLHEIQEQGTDKIDDEFAQRILSDKTATIETLREKIADQVVAQEVSDMYMTDLKPKMVEGLLKKYDFTLPNNIVEQEIDAMVREAIQHLSPEEQKENLEDKDKFFKLRQSVRPQSESTIKKAIIVEALAKKDGITVDEQEAMSALTYQAMMTGQNAQELVKYYQENNLMNSVVLAITEDKLFGQMLGFDKQ